MSESPSTMDPVLGERVIAPIRALPRNMLPWDETALVLFGAALGLGTGGMAIHCFETHQWGRLPLWGGLGVLCIGTCLVYVLLRQGRPQTITAYAQGVLVEMGRRRLVLLYQDLRGVAVDWRPLFCETKCRGMCLHLRCWKTVNFRRTPLCEADTFFKADAAEIPLVEQLLKQLTGVGVAAIKNARARGERFPGGGFRVEPTGVRVGSLHLPWENIAACQAVAKELWIWRKGEALPVIRLKLTAANAWALLSYLSEELAAAAAPPPDRELGPLGRASFERRHSRAWTWVCWSLAVPLLGAVLYCIGALLNGQRGEDVCMGLGAAALGMGFFAAAGWLLRHVCFRGHEQGVHCESVFSTYQMNDADVSSFTFAARNIYVHGAYAGTCITMALSADPAKRLPPIFYRTLIQVQDADLEALRERIVKVITDKMLTTMEAEGEVQWTPDLFLARDHIRYRAQRSSGKSDFVVLPLTDVVALGLDQGPLRLYQKGKEKPVFTVPVATPNFSPGLLLLGMLLSLPEPAAAKEEPLPELPLPGEGDGPSRN